MLLDIMLICGQKDLTLIRLDADAFSAFGEKGLFDQATATAFRKNILEKGGSDDPMKLYVTFRGQEPSIEPMLKNRGLK